MVSIVSGVPLPSDFDRDGISQGQNRKPGRPCKYPFEKMKIGECFDVPINLQASVLSAANQRRQRYGMTSVFITRRIEDKICRVWRVA